MESMDGGSVPEPRPPRRAGAWALLALKALASAILLWLALRRVPIAALGGALGTARPLWLTASLLAFLAGALLFEPLRLASGGRLLREEPVSFPAWVTLSLQSRAFLYLLPSGAGQEGFLWWRLRRRTWDHGSCAFVVAMVRVTGLAFAVLSIAWALGSHRFRPATAGFLPGVAGSPVLWAGLGGAMLGAVALAPGILRRRGLLRRYEPSGKAWMRLALATAGAGIAYALALQLGGRAFGLQVTLFEAAGWLSLVLLGMVLPISLAGLGLQEGLLLAVGQGMGMASGPLLGLGCVLHLQRFLLAMAGLAWLLLARRGALDGRQ